MPRPLLNLKASPQLVAALLSQMVSDANTGVAGDANCSMFVAFRVDAVPGVGTVMAMGAETGAHTGMRLRVLTNNSVDIYISGVGSIPLNTQDLIGGWNTLTAVKASGVSPYLIYFNAVGVNGGGTAAGNFTDAPVRYGVNAAGSERFEGEISYSVMTSSVLSAAQILALHKAALAALPTSSVVCAYKMDELTDGKFRDLSKNGNHLTAANVRMIGGQVPGGVRGRVKYDDPLQIPGALCVYDAALGVTKDGSDRVSQWDDLSGNASHLLQATGALQPLWVANGINNLPALRITNAGAEFMAASTGVFRGARRSHTLVAVVKMYAAPTSSYAGFFALGSGGSGGNTSALGHDNANKLWYGGAGLGNPVLQKVATNGETYIMVKRSNGRQDTMYLNNGRFESVPQAINYAITPIADILFGKYTAVYSSPNILASFFGAWNRELSDAEVRGLVSHLGEKYGVFNTPPRDTATGRQNANITGQTSEYATGSLTITDNTKLEGTPSTADITITDYTVMTGGNFDLLGMITLTEGVDFTAETSNEVTAQNFAAALDLVAGEPITNVVGAVITVTLGGEDNGGEIVWTGGAGVSPTTATLTGGLDKIQFLINGAGFTFPDEVTVGATAADTIEAMRVVVDAYGMLGVNLVANGNVLEITADTPGTDGNAITLEVRPSGGGTIEDDLIASGATLTGGLEPITAQSRSLAS